MKPSNLCKVAVAGLLATQLTLSAQAQEYPEIKSTKVSDGIYMLSAKGGNIGVLIGSDGTFIVDDQFSDGSGAILKKIGELGGDTPKFLINTHFHGDHTGGNEILGRAGTLIYSHHNVRKRLTQENFIKAFNFKMPPLDKDGLPVVTFSDDISFHINGEEVNAFHVSDAHTDGDAIIHFKSANVIHAGDVMFNGFYPFIDPHHGGTLKGMIEAVDKMLAISNAQTKIIPGHGPLASKEDLQAYRDMLNTAYQRLVKLRNQGKSVQEAIDSKPLADLQERWGNAMFDSNKWISIIYYTVK